MNSTITSDGEWNASYRASLRTFANFIISKEYSVQSLNDVREAAGKVICIVEHEFITVSDIHDKCSSNRWGGLIYESWAWERKCTILNFKRKLFPHEGDALIHYANSMDPMDITGSEAADAIASAQRDLYGMDDDYFDDDNCDSTEDLTEFDTEPY